ncbi:MAG TPA: hypothetical protein VN520_25420 [Streptomyces sp.]|uniref:hypothetical protein n=1 Tax=Streptomyces TaxID=1883 RepID=UPI002B7E20A5|nr:hypothetical protein [Streptomyces sp.]HWU09678.1 hypothetical protein [Streptomyces sp.]
MHTTFSAPGTSTTLTTAAADNILRRMNLDDTVRSLPADQFVSRLLSAMTVASADRSAKGAVRLSGMRRLHTLASRTQGTGQPITWS